MSDLVYCGVALNGYIIKSALNVLHSVTQSLGDMENTKDDISHNR